MTTIRRNWTNRVAKIRATARACRAYDSDSGTMVPVDPATAFEAWESTPRARLTEDTPGQKWTVHVHSNRFYVLTAEAPDATGDSTPATAAERPATPTAAPGRPPGHRAPEPARVRDHIAARTLVRRGQASGMPGGDRLGHLPDLAVDLVGKTVRVKLAQGFSHEEIRDEFERERAEAVTGGDTRRVRGLETVLTVHAAMTAEENAPEPPAGPGHRALPAPPAPDSAPADSGGSSPEEPQEHRGSPRTARASSDSVLSRIDAALHDGAVTGDPDVSGDAMRSVPLADPGDIIHAYTRAQALADGVLTAVDAALAREAGFTVPVALTSAVWEGCVAWNDGDSERQVPQDERGRLWDVLNMARAAIRRGGGDSDRVTVDLRRVPRDGRTRKALRIQLVCAIGPGDHGEPVITIMEPHED
ncbi:DUF6573 family protein [Streptomyces sp. NPDC048291]|uniref:DUF6573 family protein n=1 Tax=Streptomyces sp. NPDC048291 TaxID=3365530 RepID=UPI003719958B